MTNFYKLLLILVSGVLSVTVSGAAVTPGQTDDFDNGRTGSWKRGKVENGQLRLDADGSGERGKLVTFSSGDWAGNYITAGVNYISMDVTNPNDEESYLRLAFGSQQDANGGRWYCTNAAIIPPGTTDSNIVFTLSEATMEKVRGSWSWDEMMARVQYLRILHNGQPANMGIEIRGALFLDNITALNESGVDDGPVFTVTSVFPNPAKSYVYIKVSAEPASCRCIDDGSGEFIPLPQLAPDIQIYDDRGVLVKTVRSGHEFGSSSDPEVVYSIRLDVSQLQQGAYTAVIASGDRLISYRFMVGR